MNEEFNGKITYEQLRQIIFDYFKENQDLDLYSTSIDYLKSKLKGFEGFNGGPFFITKGEFGEARFDISKEDIIKIFKSFLASKQYEASNIEFVNDVVFTYVQNPNINQEDIEKVTINDITYNGFISFEQLRQIIFDYYMAVKGIKIYSTSIDYLKSKLRGSNGFNGGPFFITKGEFGERRFDIPNEEIQEIFRLYLAGKNYELESLDFADVSNRVAFKYKQAKQEPTLEQDEEQETHRMSI